MEKHYDVANGKNETDFKPIYAFFLALPPETKQIYLLHLNLAINQSARGENLPETYKDWTFDDLVNLRAYLENPTHLQGRESKRVPAGGEKQRSVSPALKRLAGVTAIAVASAVGGFFAGQPGKAEAGHAIIEKSHDFDEIIKGDVSIKDLKLGFTTILPWGGVKFNPKYQKLGIKGYIIDDIIQYAADHNLLEQLEQTLKNLKMHANNDELKLPTHAIVAENFMSAIDHSLDQISKIGQTT